MKKIKMLIGRGYWKAGAVVGAAMLGAPAFAQTSGGGFDPFFDAIDLSGVAAKVVAAGLLIVGIAVAFKGSDLGKRVVRKV